MKVVVTKRFDGSFQVGKSITRNHWATGLMYGEGSIVAEKEFDIPDAYECVGGGIAWRGGHISDHPAIQKWIANN